MDRISFYIPEFLLFSISIIFIVLGSLNYAISPAPENIEIEQLSQYTGRVFCIPISSIENSTQKNREEIQATMNHGYQLMITSIILGVVLFFMSLYRIFFKFINHYQDSTTIKK